MSADPLRERTGAAPHVAPYLNALGRIQDRQVVGPERIADRARALLARQFGRLDQASDTAFAHGGTGLLGGHTHYFDGFALILSLPLGTAMAVRQRDESTSAIIFEGSEDVWVYDSGRGADPRAPEWVQISQHVIGRLTPPGRQTEAAVVSTVHASCVDAYQSALGVAAARATQALFARSEDRGEIAGLVREAVVEHTGYPFSIAYPIAADAGRPQVYTLVDTHTLEHLAVEAPSRQTVGWGLVDVGMSQLRESSFHVKRREMAEEATQYLRRKGFESMTSLRDLEHKDLTLALELLPRRLRPIVRHLVAENRRVQKLVAAVRRRDWQMAGALLLMSHSSLRNDWEATNELVDLVVQETEQMSIEGMYGACTTGRGGCVLVMGQPFIVPRCLDRVQESLRANYEINAETILL